MNAEIEVSIDEESQADALVVVIKGEDLTDDLVLRHLDGSTPIFSLDTEGNLKARLRMKE